MSILKKQSFIIKGLVVFLAITLISTSVFSQISRSAEIIVNTDQPQYYPGETVYITGRIEENGTGVPSSTFCVTIFDPDGNMSGGICGVTNSQGNFSYDWTPFGEVQLGTYEVFVESYQFYINLSIYFEVVSTIIEPDANGPYEGIAGEPTSFIGAVTGGKYPYTWHWDFGDEQTSEEQNPDHTYENPGEYVATLTVTDKEGYQGNDTTNVTINPPENSPPDTPIIDGPASAAAGEEHDYTFSVVDPDGDDVYFWVEWFEGCPGVEWLGPYESGEVVTLSHTWDEEGTYTIRAKAKDIHDAESDWGTLEIIMPYVHFFDRIEQPFLRFIFDLLQLLFERFAF